MGMAYGINNPNGQISLEDSMAILNHAYDHGIKFLDSAEAYGNAHKVIGEFHERNYPKRFSIITKLPNGSKEDIVKKVDRYIKELNVNQLDALLFHSFSSYKNCLEDFGALRTLREERKINNIGVSVYTNEELEEVIANEEVDIVQVPFNVLDNNNLRGEIFEKAKENGKTIHTRSALLQGVFFKDPRDSALAVKNLSKELLLLSTISKSYAVPMSKMALSYCLTQNTIDNVLIGVDSLHQLKDNILAQSYVLEPGLVEEINGIQVENLDFLNPSLWK